MSITWIAVAVLALSLIVVAGCCPWCKKSSASSSGGLFGAVARQQTLR